MDVRKRQEGGLKPAATKGRRQDGTARRYERQEGKRAQHGAPLQGDGRGHDVSCPYTKNQEEASRGGWSASWMRAAQLRASTAKAVNTPSFAYRLWLARSSF